MLQDEAAYYHDEHGVNLVALDRRLLPDTNVPIARKLAAGLGLFLCSI